MPWLHAQVKKWLVRFPSRHFASNIPAFSFLIVALGIGPTLGAEESSGRPPWALLPLEKTISIRKTSSKETLSFKNLVDELLTVEVIFLGESHTDEATHRFQLAVYQALLERTDNRVVLALEMFERDIQPLLDDYLAGNIAEATFLEKAHPWSNYREAYRPLIELAKQSSTPVVASNFPKSLVRKFAMEGEKALQNLEEHQQRFVPQKFYANTPAYWKRVDNAVRGHAGMSFHREEDPERLFSTQSLWDNSMGEACALALDSHANHIVLHVNGGFHSAYGDGTVHQLRQRKPNAKVKTIAIVPSSGPATSEVRGIPSADFVVYVDAQATNVNRGERSVQLGKDLKYLFSQPEDTPNDSKTPLLIWLVDDGLTAKEGMQYCQQRFGDEVAIAVIEPPYPSIGEDLARGGRWYWPESFSEDVFSLVNGVENIWAYLMRHYAIDTDRICLVGDGTGGTVAAAVTVHSMKMKHSSMALHPKRYSKLKDLPLPLPKYFGDDPPPQKSLVVLANQEKQDWWSDELKQYTKAKVSSSFEVAKSDPWQQTKQELAEIRSLLGLSSPSTEASDKKQYLLLNSNTPRAWHWGKLQAIWRTQASGVPTVAVRKIGTAIEADQVSINLSPQAALEEGVLPKCPGPFGGTTVLVLPKYFSETQVAAWLELEESDPLAKASRFHRLRIAQSDGERKLSDVLKKLLSENRKNILIVPAAFYADLSWLRELRHSVRHLEDPMTLHWSPGLGGCKGILEQPEVGSTD